MSKEDDDDFAWWEYCRLGTQMPDEDAKELEKNLAQNPFNKAARGALVGYYSSRPRKLTKAETKNQIHHIFWILKNAPNCGLGRTPALRILKSSHPDEYQFAKVIVLQQCKKYQRNYETVLDLAAFFQWEETELSIEITRQVHSKASKKIQQHAAHILAAQLHKHGLETGNLDALQEAVTLMQEALNAKPVTNVDFRYLLAQYAFDAGQYALATKVCAEMLTNNFGDNQCVHVAHTILGRIDFQNNDLVMAKKHLLLSGKVKSSPRLCSYGPLMQLAQSLLEAGERDVVLQYLNDCKKFWEMGARVLAKWIREVKAGDIPTLEGDRF